MLTDNAFCGKQKGTRLRADSHLLAHYELCCGYMLSSRPVSEGLSSNHLFAQSLKGNLWAKISRMLKDVSVKSPLAQVANQFACMPP